MKKTISRIALSVLVLSSVAMAEESGVFIGIGGGMVMELIQIKAWTI